MGLWMGSLTVSGAPALVQFRAVAGTHGSICIVPGVDGLSLAPTCLFHQLQHLYKTWDLILCHSKGEKKLHYFPSSEEALASPGQEAHLCSAV